LTEDNRNTTIHGIPDDERPYEKCMKMGPSALSDAELLAIILKNGYKGESVLMLSRRLLSLSDTNKGLLGLMHVSHEELMRVKGVGKVKALQLLCVMELSKRIARARKEANLRFDCPASVADYYMEDMRHYDREVLLLIMLDGKNNLIRDMVISEGTVNCTPASPREIFREALRNNAVSILLVHNHPSGDPTPSRDDISITGQIRQAGDMVGIRLLDHIVLGDGIYRSILE